LGFGTQILGLPAQRKFVSAGYHAHEPPKTVASTEARIKILTEMYCSHQYLSIDPTKACHAHSNAHNYVLGSRVGGAFQSRFAAFISPFPIGPLDE